MKDGSEENGIDEVLIVIPEDYIVIEEESFVEETEDDADGSQSTVNEEEPEKVEVADLDDEKESIPRSKRPRRKIQRLT